MTQIPPELIFKIITEYSLTQSFFDFLGIPESDFLDFEPVIGDFTIIEAPVCAHELRFIAVPVNI